MNRAFMVWTPLHFFNVVRFVLTNKCIGECDLYIVVQSPAMQMQMENAVREGLFRNVYHTTINVIETRKRYWEIASILLPPALFVKHLYGKDAVNNTYDELYVSVPTRSNDAVYRANNCAEVIGYDDGMGSYMTDLYDYSLGQKYEKIKKITGASRIEANKVLLCTPEMNTHKGDGRCYERMIKRQLTAEEKSILYKVFDYTRTEIPQKIIYINQPVRDMRDPEMHNHKEKQILDMLRENADSGMIVRMHPRETDRSLFQGFEIQESTGMWELMCEDCVTDDHILISYFSTAMFAPKLYCSREPRLIFTYLLYEDCSPEDAEHYTELVNKLQEQYLNKSRIFIPRSLEEMKGYLN